MNDITSVDDATRPLQDAKAIYRERARRYSRDAAREAAPDESVQALVFALGPERYGVETIFVREVCAISDITPVPGTPEFVRGIVNIRGRILSVIDLKVIFGLPAGAASDQIVVLHNEEMEFGVLADEIAGAQSVAIDDSTDTLKRMRESGATHLHGVTASGIIVLDADGILRDPKIRVHQEME